MESSIDWRFLFPQNSHVEILTSKVRRGGRLGGD